MSNTEELSFEEALEKLETIVENLEDESVSLEESIELYEEGIDLSQKCTQTLEEAKLRIKKVAEQQADETDNK